MSAVRVYQVSTVLFKWFFRIWNRLSVRGLEHVPTEGGILMASNHASLIDPPVVGSAYRARPIHFMARDTLWNSKFGSWWMNSTGCIPVSRGTGDLKALRTTIKLLKEGKAVSMFPEGTRTEDGELQEAKGGIGFVIEKSECSVVPIYIEGSYESYPKGASFIKPSKVTLHYGKPITPEEFKAIGVGRKFYDEHSALIMQRIADLKAAAEQP